MINNQQNKYINVVDYIDDAMKDILVGLNKLTDMEQPSPQSIYFLSKSVERLLDAKESAIEMAGKHPEKATDEWGEADATARGLFEALATHYIGFWRCVSMYKKNPCDTTKKEMLYHLEHQLLAHDRLSEFVVGNCHTVCEDVKGVVGKWHEEKMGKMHGTH